jgi:hypothetical protein
VPLISRNNLVFHVSQSKPVGRRSAGAPLPETS